MSRRIMSRADFRPINSETFSEYTGRVESVYVTGCTILSHAALSRGRRSNCACTCRVRLGLFEWTAPK